MIDNRMAGVPQWTPAIPQTWEATIMGRGNKQPADDPALKQEVHDAVDEAADDANTGNVATVPEDEGGPEATGDTPVDLPTGARRSHPA